MSSLIWERSNSFFSTLIWVHFMKTCGNSNQNLKIGIKSKYVKSQELGFRSQTNFIELPEFVQVSGIGTHLTVTQFVSSEKVVSSSTGTLSLKICCWIMRL